MFKRVECFRTIEDYKEWDDESKKEHILIVSGRIGEELALHSPAPKT
jgi:hypothetical protein